MNPLARFGELLRYRYLLSRLVSRDLKARYKGSVLGFLWTIMNPLLVMAVLTVVFSHIVRIEVERFPVFVLCGVLPWSFLSTALINGAGSILLSGSLLKKVYFPQELFPLSAVLANLVNHLSSLTVLFVFLAVFRVPVGPAALLLPFVLLLLFCFIYGVALVVSALNVFYRDVQQILEVLLLAWFYATPIFYPVSMVPDAFVRLFLANPMASYITLLRWVLLDRSPPEGTLAYAAAVAVIAAVTAVIFGQAVFDSRKHRFAEVV